MRAMRPRLTGSASGEPPRERRLPPVPGTRRTDERETDDMSITDEAVPPLAAFLRPELPPAALHGLPGEVAVTLPVPSCAG